LFTDAGFTLIPGKDNSTSKVLVRKYHPIVPFCVSHGAPTDAGAQETIRNQTYIPSRLINLDQRLTTPMSSGVSQAIRQVRLDALTSLLPCTVIASLVCMYIRALSNFRCRPVHRTCILQIYLSSCQCDTLSSPRHADICVVGG
jgi:hypothetical protein